MLDTEVVFIFSFNARVQVQVCAVIYLPLSHE